MTDTVNPPAFPHEDTMSTGMRPGMTLLDYMAAKAMQAAITAGRRLSAEELVRDSYTLRT